MLNFLLSYFESEFIKLEPELQKAVLFGAHLAGSKLSEYATKKIAEGITKVEGEIHG